jgi:Skp family chaperone for outer membrane proteins
VASAALAQEPPQDPPQALPLGQPVSTILTLDQERLEASGIFGRVSEEINRRTQVLFEENRRIEAELVAEELELTERRATLSPEAFRALADAFDVKVQRLRNEQDAKLAELQRINDEERQNFLRQVLPIIEAVRRERGALIVLERRIALASVDAIDITDEVVARITAQFPQEGLPASLAPDPETPAASD